ncbi:neural Wiskott-Aldrich syndrome protein-like [Peromyscus leucopus]|uniref:neural Wiskott-Aldrich syndrome protein-like n=1 Tax=Peromyscus leucopus TaxID=10041 RepID=UPI00188584DC|nr:neural Wiskott-Aldrich syndrome protein-like [Peromyscus leucopus]
MRKPRPRSLPQGDGTSSPCPSPPPALGLSPPPRGVSLVLPKAFLIFISTMLLSSSPHRGSPTLPGTQLWPPLARLRRVPPSSSPSRSASPGRPLVQAPPFSPGPPPRLGLRCPTLP